MPLPPAGGACDSPSAELRSVARSHAPCGGSVFPLRSGYSPATRHGALIQSHLERHPLTPRYSPLAKSRRRLRQRLFFCSAGPRARLRRVGRLHAPCGRSAPPFLFGGSFGSAERTTEPLDVLLTQSAKVAHVCSRLFGRTPPVTPRAPSADALLLTRSQKCRADFVGTCFFASRARYSAADGLGALIQSRLACSRRGHKPLRLREKPATALTGRPGTFPPLQVLRRCSRRLGRTHLKYSSVASARFSAMASMLFLIQLASSRLS